MDIYEQCVNTSALGIIGAINNGAFLSEGGGGGGNTSYQTVTISRNVGDPVGTGFTNILPTDTSKGYPFIRTTFKNDRGPYEYTIFITPNETLVEGTEVAVLCKEIDSGEPTDAGLPVVLVVEVVYPL